MKTLFSLLIFLSPFLMPQIVFGARSMTFTVNKTSLKADEEMTVTASASGFTTGEQIFVKGAFYKEGTFNYFGYTKKGDAWIKNGADTKDQRSVKIGEWDGALVVKSDPNDSKFTDTGTYKFKVGFYTITSGGEPSNVDWSDTVTDIQLEKPTPTPTPTTTPTRTPTPQPSNTSTPAPTSAPAATTKPTATIQITKKITPTPTEEDSAEVLGTDTEGSETPTPTSEITPTPTPQVQKGPSKNVAISLLFVGLGTGLLSAVLFGKTILKKMRKQDDDLGL